MISHTHEHHSSNRPPLDPHGRPDKLYVIAVISNPIRYASRYELYKKFEDHCSTQPLVELHTVEVAYGSRQFEITDKNNPKYLQLRSSDELWHKENMINLGVQRLPDNWKYVAWIDADIEFCRKDWAVETMHQLQHYKIVQMFEKAIDLGPHGEAFQMHNGFVWSYLNGNPMPQNSKNGAYYPHWHPGYAWAMRRDAWDALGGLYDVSMIGSGDHLMAWGILGKNMIPGGVTQGYTKSLDDWMDRSKRFIHKDIGFTHGTIMHYFHGSKVDRKYRDRWTILNKFKFDPYTDIKRDWQGLYTLDMDGSDRMIGMRDAFRAYYRARREDANIL